MDIESKQLVKVITPLYTTSLNEMEKAALLNNMSVLSNYTHVLLVPAGMDLSLITPGLPPHQVVEVSDEWLGKKNGIAGYNRMMLSKEFYQLFADSEYILICHTDAWIFRDDLTEWCNKGFDCVAPSWIRRRVYDLPIISLYFNAKKRLTQKEGKITKEDIYNKIGNGGLSLRKVQTFIDGCERYKEEMTRYTMKRHHLCNEDVFWAVVPTNFNYPSLQEALTFGFDTNPKYCLDMCNGQLPFGCHSWSKPRYYKFWKNYIKL